VVAKNFINGMWVLSGTLLRAVDHPESASPGVVISSDEGGESKVGDSPCSWRIGLSISVLCWRISICGDDGSGEH